MSTVEPGGDFVALRVKAVIAETADANSFVFEVPPEHKDAFAYKSGQFVTVRPVVDGNPVPRCYSMSSSPAVDDDLRVTVKRVDGGPVSNWLAENLKPGAELHVSKPGGRFLLREGTDEVVAFAGGSGITPVLSILKTVLATTDRPARLFYANRDPESVIFAHELEALTDKYADRFSVTHHHDAVAGFVTEANVKDVVAVNPNAVFYICGPGPFMELVEKSLNKAGVGADRVHLERFTIATAGSEDNLGEGPSTSELTVVLNGKEKTATVRAGQTLLMTARGAGLPAPYSCELGTCGTCIAKLVEGEVSLKNNEVLEDWEIEEGYILMCQAMPRTPTVKVEYE